MTRANGVTEAMVAEWERECQAMHEDCSLDEIGDLAESAWESCSARDGSPDTEGYRAYRAEAESWSRVSSLLRALPLLLADWRRLREENDRLADALEGADYRESLLAADVSRYHALRENYFAADFADEQAPGKVVLKFAFPVGLKVSSNAEETLDRAIALLPKLEDARG